MSTYTNNANDSSLLGIDVSKHELVVKSVDGAIEFSVKNNAAGFKKLLQAIRKNSIEKVVLEATGGYEKACVRFLQEKLVQVAVANPKLVRRFAESAGRIEKTDPIDAQMIALYAHTHKPRNAPVLSENEQIRHDLVTRRKQLVSMQTAETNRQIQVTCPIVKKSIQTIIQAINDEIKAIEKQLDFYVEQDAETLRKEAIMTSLPGVGKTTARTLTCEIPELGNLNRGQIAKLAGLAPICNDSGNMRGKRTIGQGRKEPRTALYMAALVAKKHNPIIKEFYDRLIRKGKPHRVALVACMRKLLITLNAMLKKNELWHLVTAQNA